jgi:ABC-2 type transport system permease protein
MHTLRHYARIYLLIVSQYVKSRMQYRADFVISSLGMLFTSLATLFVFSVLFHSVPQLAGWRFEEIIFIYAFYSLAVVPLQVFFDNVWQLRYHVVEGSFIKYYLRPLNIMFYYMSEVFDIKGLVQLVIGLAALMYASTRLGLAWDVWRLGLLAVSLLSASLVTISILVIAASAAFWVIGSYPMLSLAFKVREFAQYPTSIFDGFFRFVFTYLIPIGFVAFYPAQLFLRPQAAPLLAYAAPLVGLGGFALAYFVWSKGVDHYGGTGS